MADLYDQLLDLVPESLHAKSGRVLDSGRKAFSGTRSLYVLGLNPGAKAPDKQAQTVLQAIEAARTEVPAWSVYALGSDVGSTKPFHRRVHHVLHNLGLDPCEVPASNCVFVRTRAESGIDDKDELFKSCWPVHAKAIHSLQIRVVVCMGRTAGRWVRTELRADRLVCELEEPNKRGWRSSHHVSASGLRVVTLPHPGRADWSATLSDPSAFLQKALDGSSPAGS